MFFNTGHCAQTLTTWVSLEALATASPLSVKYLNSQDRRWVRPGGYGGRVIEQQQPKTDSNASSLLVDVGLKGFGFRPHCSNSLQDFFLEKMSSSVKCVCETELVFWSGEITWMATPKSFPSSIFGMRCWIQEETCSHTQRSERKRKRLSVLAARMVTHSDDGLSEGNDLWFHLLQKHHYLLIPLDEATLWSWRGEIRIFLTLFLCWQTDLRVKKRNLRFFFSASSFLSVSISCEWNLTYTKGDFILRISESFVEPDDHRRSHLVFWRRRIWYWDVQRSLE